MPRFAAAGSGSCAHTPGRCHRPLPQLTPTPLVSLTPGSVFCSCRALCAFRAESRAQ